jgi:hypothetical protein
VPTGPTSGGDTDGVGRHRLIDRSQRHRPRRGDRRQAETNSKRRYSKHFHGFFLSYQSLKLTRRLLTMQKKRRLPNGAPGLTSNGGAGGDANPNDGGANAIAGANDDASDDASAPLRVSACQLRRRW